MFETDTAKVHYSHKTIATAKTTIYSKQVNSK